MVEWIGDKPEYFRGQPEPVTQLCNVVTVALAVGMADNSSRQVALLRNRTVVQRGAKYDEELAAYAWPPSELTNVLAPATSSRHTFALRSDGTVVGWGDNGKDQSTGVPSKPSFPHGPIGAWHTVTADRPLSNIVALATALEYSHALREAGGIVAWGRMVNDLYPAYVPSGLSGVVFIAAGENLCYAITTNPVVPAKWQSVK